MSYSEIVNTARPSEEEPWVDLEISDLLDHSEGLPDSAAPASDLTNEVAVDPENTSELDDFMSSLFKPTEKAPRKRRIRKERNRKLVKWERKSLRPGADCYPFGPNKYYENYASFVSDVRTYPTRLPDENCTRIDLKAFPKKYRSPTEVPRIVQKDLSHARFFYVRGLVYRPEYGHALYIVPRRSAEQGRILHEFRRYSGRREVFHLNPITKAVNYLGEFRLVKSVPFPYSRRECGKFPELAEAHTPPLRGNLEPSTVFYVLQFMRYNYNVLDEFVTA